MNLINFLISGTMKIKFIALLVSLFVLQNVFADDHKEKLEKAYYFEASFSSFHPGGNLRASEIIEDLSLIHI